MKTITATFVIAIEKVIEYETFTHIYDVEVDIPEDIYGDDNLVSEYVLADDYVSHLCNLKDNAFICMYEVKRELNLI